MTEHEWISVLKILPCDGERCICYGHKTYCCKEDMDDEPNEHEVIFKFNIGYKCLQNLPDDPEDSLVEYATISETWDTNITDKYEPGHVIGVTKWKKI